MKNTLFLVCLIGITFACVGVKAGPRVYLVSDGVGKKQGPVNKDEQEIRGIKCKCKCLDGSWGTYSAFNFCPKGTICGLAFLGGVCCH